MRIPERIWCSRLPAGSVAQNYLARKSRVAHRATTAGGASKTVILLWILAVAARLILIDQPYVDHWSWRQSDVAAIARNFSEGGFRFAYPQIDWAGDATGYVGTEFPSLPFVAAICYKLTGIHEWIGRSQAVIFFAVSLPFFFLLVREIFGKAAAVWATFFYSFAPLNIFAGRSFMPDVPSLSLAIIGMYLFLRCVEHRASLCEPSPESFRGWKNTRQHVRWAHRLQAYVPLLVGAIAISLSILIKFTIIVIFAPLLYLAVAALSGRWRNKERRFPKPPGRPAAFVTLRRAGGDRPSLNCSAGKTWLQLLTFVAIALLPSALWYWHAYQIAERFYPHHLFGAGGLRIESLGWYWDIARQTATSSLTPVLVIMALIGLFVAPRSKYSLLFHWWLAGMILFMIVVGYRKSHPSYLLPLLS